MYKEVFDFYDRTSLKSYNLDQTMRYQLNMLDRLDVFTRKHCENVGDLTCRLCQHLHCNKGFTEYCTICGYLHDIGKQFIPPAILQKPGKLTDEEYEIMKTHTTIGYQMCMKDVKLQPYAVGPYCHHEALDGSGYPRGLTKNKIPYEYICWKNILADIEPMPLRLNYKAEKLTQKVFEKILQYDFMDYWFLDKDYSDEYQEFLEILDKTSPDNYEKIIEENLENVFYKEEYHIWSERILNTALLKHLAKDEEAAQNLYSLYNDKEFKRELFKNILRKSIYEYYFAQQDNEKINAIEDMWVKNV